MKQASHSQNLLILMVAASLLIGGCVPILTTQARKADIQFLADGADKYNPFVEVRERIKGCPSYRELLSLACVLPWLCSRCHTIKPTMHGECIRPGLCQEWHILFDESSVVYEN